MVIIFCVVINLHDPPTAAATIQLKVPSTSMLFQMLEWLLHAFAIYPALAFVALPVVLAMAPAVLRLAPAVPDVAQVPIPLQWLPLRRPSPSTLFLVSLTCRSDMWVSLQLSLVWSWGCPPGCLPGATCAGGTNNTDHTTPISAGPGRGIRPRLRVRQLPVPPPWRQSSRRMWPLQGILIYATCFVTSFSAQFLRGKRTQKPRLPALMQ